MEWFGIIWAIMALILVGPAAIRMIRGNPTGALRNVAFWLGIAVFLAFLFRYGGLEQWWAQKRGYAPPMIERESEEDYPPEPAPLVR